MQIMRPVFHDDPESEDTGKKAQHEQSKTEDHKTDHPEKSGKKKEAQDEPQPESNPVSQEFIAPQRANGPIFVSLGVSPEFIAQINQDAGILTPAITLPENGDAFLDEQQLQDKAKELVRFVNKAAEKYTFDRKELVWIGHSNGANMVTSVMLFYPTVIQKAVLLRPNTVVTPKPLPVFADVFVHLSVGRQDESVPPENTEKLIRVFQQCGAVVELFQYDAGHELTEADPLAIQKWFLRQH